MEGLYHTIVKNRGYRMKKVTIPVLRIWKLFFVVLISCVMMFSVVVQPSQTKGNNDISLTYSFNSPTIETVDIAGILYNKVTLEDCYAAGAVGEPNLPSKGAFLLLPPKS